MLNVAFPRGTVHGWGIAGSCITAELSRLTEIYQVESATAQLAPGPLLQPVLDYHLGSVVPCPSDVVHVGYCFLEWPSQCKPYIAKARECWDHLVTGSQWCAEGLQRAGFPSVSVAIQGVDTVRFQPALSTGVRQYRDRFVVISVGKAEYRKGTDLAIRAFKVLCEHHSDVFLLASWGNTWEVSMRTLEQSQYIDYRHDAGKTWRDRIDRVMVHQGITKTRYELVDLVQNYWMPRLYQQADVGLFLSRCEAGTNLPYMECSACEVPAIVTAGTGHQDVIYSGQPLVVHKGSTDSEGWFEPDFDEIVDTLEWAYQHQGMLPGFGSSARMAMHQFPWRATAQALLDAVQGAERVAGKDSTGRVGKYGNSK